VDLMSLSPSIPGNAADRQMMLAKGVANLAAFVLRDGFGREIHVLKTQIELDGIEIELADFLGRRRQPVGEIAGKYANLHHDGFLRAFS
jgi:hypothetical protein